MAHSFQTLPQFQPQPLTVAQQAAARFRYALEA
jgi:hypothetical protein